MLSNMIRIKFILLTLMLSFVFSCSIQNLETMPKSTFDKQEEFIIGPEDLLQIHVWKQPELSTTVPVRSDGKISTPLINEIQASGRTPIELKEDITERLLNFIDEPTVSVVVVEINSLKISISGNVQSPGIFKIGEKISLVDAMSLAGGVNRLGNSKKIRIIRKSNGAKRIYQVNYQAIISEGEINQNIFIYPGDSIIVP